MGHFVSLLGGGDMPAKGGAYEPDEQFQDSMSEANKYAMGRKAADSAAMLRSTQLANAHTGGRPFGK
jgi:hypothetical protein